eukprot:c26619_g1_i1 orf=502-2373(-)
MASDDSLDDMLLEAAGRTKGSDRRGSSGTLMKRRHADSSSDDEPSDSKSDNDDEDDFYDDDRGRRSSGSKMPLKKRFEAADKDEDDEDDEGHDGYDSDLSFGSDLYKDEEDRSRLAAMTELDREMILHDRAEARENFLMRKRAEARQKRESGGGKPVPQGPPQSRMRSSVRDSSKSVKENALNELVARRQKAHDRDMAASRDREPSPVRRKSRESSFSLSDSDSSDDESISREDDEGSEGLGSDDDRVDEGEKPTYEDIKGITILRSKLLKWFLEPFFEDIIVGCFVRIAIGFSRENRRMYRLCQVKNVDARDIHKQYKFENRMTHKYLNCVWGDDASAARWQMARVSDQDSTEREFQEWEREVERCGGRRISMSEINEKKEAIAKLSTFVYSAALVKQMLQEKKMSASRPSNIAAERDRLLKEIAVADSKGDDVEVERLQARLKDLEVYAAKSQSKDAKALALAQMNKRNRYENFKNASELKPVNTHAKAGEAGYDPFSRRWTRSQNYYRKDLGPVGTGEDIADGEAATAAAQEAAADAGKLVDTKAPVDNTTKLFSVHNFHLPISLVGIQKFGGAQGAHLAFIARKQQLEATCGVQVSSNDGRRHSLTLTVNDYKRRRGLL